MECIGCDSLDNLGATTKSENFVDSTPPISRQGGNTRFGTTPSRSDLPSTKLAPEPCAATQADRSQNLAVAIQQPASKDILAWQAGIRQNVGNPNKHVPRMGLGPCDKNDIFGELAASALLQIGQG